MSAVRPGPADAAHQSACQRERRGRRVFICSVLLVPSCEASHFVGGKRLHLSNKTPHRHRCHRIRHKKKHFVLRFSHTPNSTNKLHIYATMMFSAITDRDQLAAPLSDAVVPRLRSWKPWVTRCEFPLKIAEIPLLYHVL